MKEGQGQHLGGEGRKGCRNTFARLRGWRIRLGHVHGDYNSSPRSMEIDVQHPTGEGCCPLSGFRNAGMHRKRLKGNRLLLKWMAEAELCQARLPPLARVYVRDDRHRNGEEKEYRPGQDGQRKSSAMTDQKSVAAP
ncbi:MAG: hypothetical protein IPJ06_15505 [Saprospiraceae bacterium]|nr:hypothetical protein [Saprospiraceae bacterium]